MKLFWAGCEVLMVGKMHWSLGVMNPVLNAHIKDADVAAVFLASTIATISLWLFFLTFSSFVCELEAHYPFTVIESQH